MKRKIEKGNGGGWFFTMLQVVLLLGALPGAAFCASVMLDWDPSTDAELAGYRVYYQANSSATPFIGVDAAEGSAPIDVAGANSATINGLDPGNSYYFAVTAYNFAGQESIYSNIVEINEAVAPTVSITSPTGSSSVSGMVPVAVAAIDNKGVSSVEFYVNGVLQGTDAESPYGFQWDTSSLSSGLYTVMAKGYDAAGNVGQGEVQVAVAGDTTAPTVTISVPADNGSVSGNVTITATADDNVGVSKVELYDNGTLILAGNQSQISYNWDSVAAGNGSHVIAARAFDAAGNYQTASVSVVVVNDFTSPSVAITSPVAGSTLGATVDVSATATDDIDVTVVEFYLNGVLQGADSSAPYGFTWNTLASANGAYTVTARAYDAAGNIGQSASVAVTVSNDTTAPAVSISAPVSGITVDASVAVTVSANDDVEVARIDLYLNGSLLATSNGVGFTFNWNTSAVAEGTYQLSARAYDAAGNVGESGFVTITVLHAATDTTAPTITFTAPMTSGPNTRISASATDDVAVVRMDLYLDGQLQASETSGSVNIKVKLGPGLHEVAIKAYDAAGNVGSATMSVNR